MISLHSCLFVTIDKEFADSIKLEGSDFELALRPGTGPGEALQHVREFGYVVATPPYLHKTLKTTMDARKGEKVYFHFHIVEEENDLQIKSKDGQAIYRAPYPQCYCVIRDGSIKMLNHYILCTPIMESEEDCTTESGLWLKSKPDPKHLRAKVEYMPDYDTGFAVGDTILYSKESDCEMKIEGKTYYRMSVNDVMAIV